MTNIREFLASNLRGFIIRFLSRELHSLAGGEMGPKAKGDNQSATSGRISQGSATGGGEDTRPHKFSIAGVATQFVFHENVPGKSSGTMQATQGQY